MAQGFCPECDAEVGLGKTVKLGQRVTCHSCGAYLEVIDTAPIELDWAFEDDGFDGADEDLFDVDDEDDDDDDDF